MDYISRSERKKQTRNRFNPTIVVMATLNFAHGAAAFGTVFLAGAINSFAGGERWSPSLP
jgi:hypothetical protein